MINDRTVRPDEFDLPLVGRAARESDPRDVTVFLEDQLRQELVVALGARGGQPVVAALRAEQLPAVRLRLEERERLLRVRLHELVARTAAEPPVAAVANETPTCNAPKTIRILVA